MTERQEIFFSHLKKQLCWGDDLFFSEYRKALIPMILKNKPLYSIYNRRKPPSESPQENFSIIDIFLLEVNLKKKIAEFSRNEDINTISASDIANYTYCPVSYAIGKTYRVPANEDTTWGQLLHERKWLINVLQDVYNINISETKIEKVTYAKTRFGNWEFFYDVKNSILKYQGHISDYLQKKYFSNCIFRGSPDYIFFNPRKKIHFVVEEKFQWVTWKHRQYKDKYLNDEKINVPQNEIKLDQFPVFFKPQIKQPIFFDNHKNQLLSYIFGIPDYNIAYGYLVYWKYEMVNNIPNIMSCNILKVNKSIGNKKKLHDISSQILNVVKNKGGVFDINNRTPIKCARCANCLLCGHKTGRFNTFTLPYNNKYTKLVNNPFPEELKKKHNLSIKG